MPSSQISEQVKTLSLSEHSTEYIPGLHGASDCEFPCGHFSSNTKMKELFTSLFMNIDSMSTFFGTGVGCDVLAIFAWPWFKRICLRREVGRVFPFCVLPKVAQKSGESLSHSLQSPNASFRHFCQSRHTTFEEKVHI